VQEVGILVQSELWPIEAVAPRAPRVDNFHPIGGPRKVNRHYFDVIDTEEKAYWLGFIAADGWVTAKQVKLALAAVDADHVRAFRDVLDSDATISRREKSANSGHWGGARVEVAISSIDLVQALAVAGIHARKSLTAEPWAGPLELMRHYWRGAFDGDGGFHKEPKERGWSLSFVGSQAMVAGFSAFARQATGSSAKMRPKKGGIWGFEVHGRLGPRRLSAALYEDVAVALPRKLAFASELLATPERQLRWNGRGERHFQPTPEDYEDIRWLARAHSQSKIARYFGVSQAHISNIVNRRYGNNGPMQRKPTRPRSKLTTADVARIRALLAEGWTQEAIATEFAVSRPLISKIKHGLLHKVR
jgi:predicted XRE-type DNA-binding protein